MALGPQWNTILLLQQVGEVGPTQRTLLLTFSSSAPACPESAAKWLAALGGVALEPQIQEVSHQREGGVDHRGCGGKFLKRFLEAAQLPRPEGRGEGKGKRIFCHLVTFLPRVR